MDFTQPTWRRFLSAAMLVLGLGWTVWTAPAAEAVTGGSAPAPRAGFLAPDFQLSTLDGDLVTLSGLRGQVVVLNLWTTWCPPCRAEMPALQRVFADYQDRGLIVLAVNSTAQDSFADIAPFIQEYGLTFPVLLDLDGAVSRLYLLRSLPTTYFIDRAGVIQEVVVGGPMAEALIRTRVEALLEGTP